MNAKMLSDLCLSAYRRLYFEDETADDSVQTLREAWEEQRSKPGITVIRIASRNVLSNIFTKFRNYIKQPH